MTTFPGIPSVPPVSDNALKQFLYVLTENVQLLVADQKSAAVATSLISSVNQGYARIVSLDYYAGLAGIDLTVDGVNIQPAIDLAEAQMQAPGGASAPASGLYVYVPPGNYKLNKMRLYNRCGYFCNLGTVRLTCVVVNPAAPVPFVALGDIHAVSVVFYNFKHIEGGWTYGRAGYSGAGGDLMPEQDPWLFQYGAVTTANSSTPDSTAQIGQTAVYLMWDFANDPAFIANSNDGVYGQEPRGLIGNLGVWDFGGDAYAFQGAGSLEVCNLACEGVGGRGLAINGYDSNFTAMDMGACGLEGITTGPNGSSIRILLGKIWFSGQRQIAGHQSAMRLDRSEGVQFLGQLQDATGDMITAIGPTFCTIDAVCDYQGGTTVATQHDIAFLTMYGGSLATNPYGGVNTTHNQFRLSCHVAPVDQVNVLRLVRSIPVTTTLPTATTVPIQNIITIVHDGMPNDFGVWNPLHFVGDLDYNIMIVNSQIRQPRQWVGDSTDRLFFGATPRNGQAWGFQVSDAASAYPGSLNVIAGANGGVLETYADGSAHAAQTLVSTANFVDGDTFEVDGRIYLMQATLTDSTASYSPHIQIGATLADSMQNICDMVNGNDATRGTAYCWQAVPAPSVSAATDGVSTLTLTAILAGTLGNYIATTATCAHAAMSGATLAGGTSDPTAGWYQSVSWNYTGGATKLSFGNVGGASAPLMQVPLPGANQASVSLTSPATGAPVTADAAIISALKTDVANINTLLEAIRAGLIIGSGFGLLKGSA